MLGKFQESKENIGENITKLLYIIAALFAELIETIAKLVETHGQKIFRGFFLLCALAFAWGINNISPAIKLSIISLFFIVDLMVVINIVEKRGKTTEKIMYASMVIIMIIAAGAKVPLFASITWWAVLLVIAIGLWILFLVTFDEGYSQEKKKALLSYIETRRQKQNGV